MWLFSRPRRNADVYLEWSSAVDMRVDTLPLGRGGHLTPIQEGPSPGVFNGSAFGL